MPELRALTSLRGIAAWFVVLFHLRMSIAPSLPEGVLAVLGKGYLAVDLFFVLSGFVIGLSYADRLRDGGLAGAPAFLIRRVARIWPLHLAMLGFAAALALLLALTGRDTSDYPWHELPFHLLLVQNWWTTPDLSWNEPAWSISCELAAYLVFPLFVLAVDWRRPSVWALVAAIAGLALALHALFAGLGHARLGDAIPLLGVPRCLLAFAIGTATCALWQRRCAPWVAVAVAAALALAWSLGAPETLVVVPLWAALILTLASAKVRPLEGRWIHLLGELSYATYLSHFLLFRLFKLLFVSDASDMPLWQAGVFMVLLVPISAALYFWWERPAQRWINGRFASKRSPPTPAELFPRSS